MHVHIILYKQELSLICYAVSMFKPKRRHKVKRLVNQEICQTLLALKYNSDDDEYLPVMIEVEREHSRAEQTETVTATLTHDITVVFKIQDDRLTASIYSEERLMDLLSEKQVRQQTLSVVNSLFYDSTENYL